jgi:hypothetical protein
MKLFIYICIKLNEMKNLNNISTVAIIAGGVGRQPMWLSYVM